jgi:hypothetical protein
MESFHFQSMSIVSISMEIVRHNGKWYKIIPKAYEPEKQTNTVAWSQILDPLLTPEAAYRKFYEQQREDAKVLYPSFRKDAD